MDDLDKKDLETIDIETPIDETPPPTPVPVVPNIPSPKKSKKKLIIGIIIALVLLAAAGFAYYWFFVKEEATTVTKSSEKIVAQVETPTADTRDYAKELIEKVRASVSNIKTEYPKSKVENTDAYAPPYKYGSNMYYVAGQFGYSLLITESGDFNEAFNNSAEEAVFAVLEKENLVKDEEEYLITFTGDTVVCNASNSSYPVYVSCANTRDYKTPSEIVEPFAKAYFASPNATDGSEIVFGQPKINEKSDGYKNASVSINGYNSSGGFAGLYSGKNNVWTFWKGSQSVIDCSEYNTFELQKSFEGDSCYIEGQTENSVVKVTLKQ